MITESDLKNLVSVKNTSTSDAEKLRQKIKRNKVKVSVIGLGYTGLPLCMNLADAGIEVCGIDKSAIKVKKANNSISYISDLTNERLEKAIESGYFNASTDYSPIEDSDVIVICVPTPLNKNMEPDLSAVKQCMKSIRQYKLKGKLVILESTTYPGTTREIALPALNNGYLAGRDYFLAYSPERIDPGNNDFGLKNTTRVVGGITKECGMLAKEFFELFVNKVKFVSSSDIAEMTKLFENTFRSVNIALVNEMALMCDRMGLDVWEIMEAAATKEYGFMPFKPGPGLGGHCIPIDPHYLSWKAKEFGFYSDFIELAGKRNASMPYYVFSKISDALNDQGQVLSKSKILILGVAYKKDINDLRESPALKVIELLKKKGATISYSDPHIENVRLNGYRFTNTALSDELISSHDCTVIITDHTGVDYKRLLKNSKLVVDTRNVYKGIENPKIVRI